MKNRIKKYLVSALMAGFLLSFTNINFAEAGNRPDEINENPAMSTLFENGLSLVGAQYWVFVGSVPFHFPEDVLWGFYPDEVSDNAVGCAEQSFIFLKDYIKSDWVLMQKAISLGATNQIYFLTTDYSYSAGNRNERSSRIWHSAGQAGDISSGYWIWESTKGLDGSCVMPEKSEIETFLKKIIEDLEGQ